MPWSDTGRLWGVDDVDGDGTTDIWAGELMESPKGLWSLALAVYHPATGRTEAISYSGDQERFVVPEPEEITPAVIRGRARDWLIGHGAVLVTSGTMHVEGWQAERPFHDAGTIFSALRPWGWRSGPVPRIEVPIEPDPGSAGDTIDCARDGVRFGAGDPLLWRVDLRRHVTYPIFLPTSGAVESMAIGRRYLWIAKDADEHDPPAIVAYDIPGNRLVNVRIPTPPREDCGSGYCTLERARFGYEGDTLYLGSVPFRVPAEYGGEAELRGAVVCGEV